MVKLTLSIDERVVDRAKRYARQNGTSVSRVVETMLSLVSRPDAKAPPATPVLARLRGSMKRADISEYRRYLRGKYR